MILVIFNFNLLFVSCRVVSFLFLSLFAQYAPTTPPLKLFVKYSPVDLTVLMQSNQSVTEIEEEGTQAVRAFRKGTLSQFSRSNGRVFLAVRYFMR